MAQPGVRDGAARGDGPPAAAACSVTVGLDEACGCLVIRGLGPGQAVWLVPLAIARDLAARGAAATRLVTPASLEPGQPEELSS